MTLDVRARLAEGAAAVADSPQQIQDWYYAEDGLRLDIVDADAAALTAASEGAEEALHIQREAFDLLSHSWRGGSGSGAGEFLARQSAAAAEVVASLRSAAVALSALRVGLEHLVDAKVDAALGGVWSAVPGSGAEGAAAYGVAVSRLGELPAPRFETPARPAELTQPPPAIPPPPQPVPDQVSAPMAAPVSAPVSPLPGQGWASGAPVGALPGISDIAGSLTGLVTWIAQTLGSYADTPTTPQIADTTDISPPDDPVDDVKPVAPEQHSSPKTPLAAESPAPVTELPAPVPVTDPPAPEPPAPQAPAPQTPAAPLPPPPPPPPAPTPAADVATPCEIAADELPRVGQ
jgi:hypothetical protein